MRNTQFNIDAIPLDAYLTLWRSLKNEEEQERLLDLNQAWFFDLDFDLYDNRINMFDKLLCGFPDVAREYRWLNQVLTEIPKHERVNHATVFATAYASEQDKQFESFISNMRTLHYFEQVNKTSRAMFPGVGPAIPVPSLERFRVENLGSWGVATLTQAKPVAERIFYDSMVLLYAHYLNTGFSFRLRHPLAMGHATSIDKLLATRHPISNLEIALGESRWKAYGELVRIAAGAFPSGIDFRHQFDRWSRLTATATFQHESDKDNRFITCLTPTGLPAILTMPSHDRLPLTLEKHLTPSLGDEWQMIQRLEIAEIIDGSINATHHHVPVVPHEILDLGWLACMAASIISMNVKVGSGQTRIKWLHSVMNATHVNEAMVLAPMILDRANQRIHHAA